MGVSRRLTKSFNDYRDAIMSTYPIMYLPLTETSGTVATDQMGNYNGSYNGVTLNQLAGAGSTMSPAPRFDGINDNVNLYTASLESRLDYRTTGSFFMWLYGASQGRYVIKLSSNTVSPNVFNISMSREVYGMSYMHTGASNVTSNCIGFATLPTTDWFYVGVRWNVGELPVMYLQGTLNSAFSNATTPGNANLASAHCTLGSFGASSFYNGYIAHFALWNRQLTNSEFELLAENF